MDVSTLNSTAASTAGASGASTIKAAADTQDRVRETLRFMESLGAWADEMLRLSPNTLEKVLKLGASVQRLVR